jgi:hypothetical protein
VPGLGVLSLSTVVAPSEVAEACARLEARLDHLLPFTRRHLVAARQVGLSPRDVARHGLFAGPLEPWVLGGRGLGGGLKRLIRAGRDVAPVMGVEGELWAGQAAAKAAERIVLKRSWFGGEAPQPPVVVGPRLSS